MSTLGEGGSNGLGKRATKWRAPTSPAILVAYDGSGREECTSHWEAKKNPWQGSQLAEAKHGETLHLVGQLVIDPRNGEKQLMQPQSVFPLSRGGEKSGGQQLSALMAASPKAQFRPDNEDMRREAAKKPQTICAWKAGGVTDSRRGMGVEDHKGSGKFRLM